MSSPWLDIPLADYEGHMALPRIGQSAMLAAEFACLLDGYRPQSVAVIGCAGGNGFERLRPEVTRRVVGIDLNPQYIRELAARQVARIPGLELYVHDIQRPAGHIAPVDFIYAGLVFEYVAPQPVLQNLSGLCRAGGVLVVVLQLPSDDTTPVSPSPFRTLEGLASTMQLVAPTALAAAAAAAGFELCSARTVRLASGKEFSVQVFELTAAPGSSRRRVPAAPR